VPGNAGLSRCHQPAQLPLGCAAHCCCAMMYTTVLPWYPHTRACRQGSSTQRQGCVLCMCVCTYGWYGASQCDGVLCCFPAACAVVLRPGEEYRHSLVYRFFNQD
jgi:hypothetical protein